MTTLEKVLAVALVAVIIVAVVALSLEVHVTSHGHITAIGLDVWKDAGLTQQLTDIDWGTLDPGSMVGIIFYARNYGNVNVTLSMQVGNWTFNGIPEQNFTQAPNSSQYFAFSWNCTGYLLQSTQVVTVNMTLAVSPLISNKITIFTNDIVIKGTKT
jgi:hypothetical protein